MPISQRLSTEERMQLKQAIRARDQAMQDMLRSEENFRRAQKELRSAERASREAKGTDAATRREQAAHGKCEKLHADFADKQKQYGAARQQLDTQIGQLRPELRREADYLSRKSQIRSVFNAQSPTSRTKGDLGERITFEQMDSKGYKFLGSAERPAQGRGRRQGIDSVWEKNGQYYVVETKWHKHNSSRRSRTEGHTSEKRANKSMYHRRDRNVGKFRSELGNTSSGRQGSKQWVDSRLEACVGSEKAGEIKNKGYYVFVHRVHSSGRTRFHNITESGQYRSKGTAIKKHPPRSLDQAGPRTSTSTTSQSQVAKAPQTTRLAAPRMQRAAVQNSAPQTGRKM